MKSKNNANQGPDLLQCSGGDGNDAPSMNQPTVNQCQQSRQTTANPSHGYGNNGGGFGGDGNDPPKRNPESLKGHYLESDVPLKKKGIFEYTLCSHCSHNLHVRINIVFHSNRIEAYTISLFFTSCSQNIEIRHVWLRYVRSRI